MILFNAALAEECWEPLLALPSEQRRVAGQEPRSEQRSEGQPGYLGVSLLHLRHHRAPISATPPTDTAIQPMGIPLTVIRATRSRAMDIQATRVLPVPGPMDIKGILGSLLTPVRRAMNSTAMPDTPLSPVCRATNTMAMLDTLLSRVRRAMNTAGMLGTPLNPVPPTMDIKAARHIRPIPVPVTGILSMTIPATALRRIGLLDPSTPSSLLAEFSSSSTRSSVGAGSSVHSGLEATLSAGNLATRPAKSRKPGEFPQ
jgi:hypothetical protein